MSVKILKFRLTAPVITCDVAAKLNGTNPTGVYEPDALDNPVPV